MTMRHVIRPRAIEDVDEHLDFYARESGPSLALRFLTSLEEAIRFLHEHPEAGAPRKVRNRRLRGLRSWPVPGFADIRLYYLQPEPDLLRVIRVLHGKRDVDRILTSDRN